MSEMPPASDPASGVVRFPAPASAGEVASIHAPPPSDSAPCRLSGQFLDLFELLTGWRAEFVETPASQSRRQSGRIEVPPEGKFTIVDMSELWPARQATAHRGRADRLVEMFGALMDQLQATRIDLVRVQSALEALAPGSLADDAELVDSFVPKFQPMGETVSTSLDATATDHLAVTTNQTDHTGESSQGSIYDSVDANTLKPAGCDDEHTFVVHQPVNSVTEADRSLWKHWSFGGSTGLAGSAYLDSFLSGGNLFLCVGRIESSHGVGDTELRAEINPITNQIRLEGSGEMRSIFLWDRRGGSLDPIVQLDQWMDLWPGAALVASTKPILNAPDPQAELSSQPSADQLATVLQRQLESEDRVVVLKRD